MLWVAIRESLAVERGKHLKAEPLAGLVRQESPFHCALGILCNGLYTL